MADTDGLNAMFHGPEYHWWRRALIRDRLDTRDGAFECGLYRWRNMRVRISLVADGEKLVTLNGDSRPLDLLDWVRISSNPVTPEAFNHHLQHNEWPGSNPLADRTLRELGSNQAPPDNSPEALSERLYELEREAKRIIQQGAATTQAAADEAAKVSDALGLVAKAMNDKHRIDKAPLIAAGKELDRIWFPLRDRADGLRAAIKAAVLLPFLKADEIKRQAENAALIAQGAEHISAPKAKATGTTRSTALRDHPEIVSLVHDIANRSARAGVELPGMSIKREKIAV